MAMSSHGRYISRYNLAALLLPAALAFCPYAAAQERLNNTGTGNQPIDSQSVKKKGLQRPAGELRLRENSRDARGEADRKEIREKKRQRDRQQAEKAEEEIKDSKREAKEQTRDALKVIKDSRELKKEAIRSISGE